jgi:hypothetical protein
MTLLPLPPPAPGQAGLYASGGRLQRLRRLMTAGGQAPAGQAGPMHVHQGDEVLRGRPVRPAREDSRMGALYRTPDGRLRVLPQRRRKESPAAPCLTDGSRQAAVRL